MPEHSDSPGTSAPVFRIIVHASPPLDHGFTHWTEAPECPAAHDGGASVEQAVSRTKERIRAWWAAWPGRPAGGGAIEFSVEEAL